MFHPNLFILRGEKILPSDPLIPREDYPPTSVPANLDPGTATNTPLNQSCLTETDGTSVAETGPNMHAPNRSLHPTATSAEESLRREAEHFLLVSGAGLIDVLRRSAGKHGLALGFAFRDIVLDRETPPTSWPIDDVLDVLTSDDAKRDNRSASLEASLSDLSRLIDDVECASWEDSGEEASAPGRLAA